MFKKLIAIVLSIGLMIPLLGNSSGEVKEEVFNDYSSTERYASRIGVSQPHNPSGVGTYASKNNYRWYREAMSMWVHGAVTVSGNYEPSRSDTAAYGVGVAVKPDGSGNLMLYMSIEIKWADGKWDYANLLMKVMPANFHRDSVPVIGNSLVDNILLEEATPDRLKSAMSSGPAPGYLNAVLYGYRATDYGGVNTDYLLYKHGASAYKDAANHSYNYANFAKGYDQTKTDTLSILSDGYFDIAFTLPKIPTLDNVPPVVSFSPNSRGWGNTNSVVQITSTDNVSQGEIYYRTSTNGGSWSGWTLITSGTNVTFSNTGYYRINVDSYDARGNKSNTTSGYFHVDKTAPSQPTINRSRGDVWGNTATTFTLTGGADGHSGFNRYGYQINGGTWIGSTTGGTVTVSDEGVIPIRGVSIDNVENWGPQALTYAYNDFTNPLISTSLSNTGWTNSSVNIITNASDALSGLSTVTQTSALQPGQNYTAITDINTTSSNYGFGNTTLTQNLEAGKTYTLTYNGSVNATAVAEGKHLRVYVYEPSWTHGSFSHGLYTTTASTNSFTFTPSWTGAYQVNAYMFPNGGDRNGSVRLNWVKLEEGTEFTGKSYSPHINFGATGSIPVYTNGTYYFKAVDVAGNVQNRSRTVSNIDKTKPTLVSANITGHSYANDVWRWFKPTDLITVDQTMTDTESGLMNLYAQITDNASFMKRIGISHAGGTPWVDLMGPATPTFEVPNASIIATSGNQRTARFTFKLPMEGKYSYFAQTLDQAWNWAGVTEAQGLGTGLGIGIDGTAPTPVTITTTPSTTGWNAEDVTVMFKEGTDSGSGIKVNQYKINGGAWTTYTAPFVLSADGTHTVYARSIDFVGNISAESSKVVQIDKTKPNGVANSMTGEIYKNGNDYWTRGGTQLSYTNTGYDGTSNIEKQYVRLTGDISGADIRSQHVWHNSAGHLNNFAVHPNISVVSVVRGAYTGGNGTLTWNIVPTAIEDDYNVWYYYYDYAGNSYGYHDTGFNIRVDATAPTVPTITPSKATWSNTDVVVTLSGSTDARSGIAKYEYKIGSGAWQTYTTPFTVSSAGTTAINARSVDNVGYISAESTRNVLVDKTAPTVNASSINYDWSAVSRQIGLTFTDSTSGIATRQYKVTSTSDVPTVWDNYTGAIDLITHGYHYIHYRAVDTAGNETVGYFGPYKIDKVNPSGTFNPNSQTWTNGNVGVLFTPSDGASGVSSWRYRTKIDSGAYGAWSVVYTTPQTITLSAQGIHQIEAEVTDSVGNVGNVVSGVYQIDKTLPTVSANPSSAVWRNTGISVTLSYSDLGGSGVSERQYALSTSSTVEPTTWTNYTVPVNINTTGAWYIWYRAVDAAGNISINKIGTYNIDLVNPNVIANISNRTWDSSDITVTLSYSDSGGSGVKARRYAWSNSTTVPTVWLNYSSAITQSAEGQWYLHTQVEDNAGNITTKYFGVYQSDKANPTVAFSPMSRYWGNLGLTVSMNPDDGAGSGVQVWRYRTAQNGSSATPTYGAWSAYIAGDVTSSVSLSSQGEWKIQVEVIDNVGNIGLYTSGTYLIDRTLPNVTLSTTSAPWRNTDMAVTITPTDYSGVGTSGVVSYRYRLSANNGASYGTYINIGGSGSVTIPLTAQGEWVIDVDVFDVAGNTRNIKSGVYLIDKTLPNGSYSIMSGGWSRTNLSTRFTPNDNTGIGGSGVKQYNWVHKLDGVVVGSGTVVGAGYKDYLFTEDGVNTVETTVIDNANNVRTVNSGNFLVDKTAPIGNNTINYDEHTGVYTVIPSGIMDSTAQSNNVSGMNRWVITFIGRDSAGNIVGTYPVTRNTYTGNTIVNIHNQFSGKADRVEVTSRIYDNAGNYRDLQSRTDEIFIVKTDIVRVLNNGVTNAVVSVGKSVDVSGGELMRIKIEALGNPDRVVVTGVGRKVLNPEETVKANWIYGAYGTELKNFNYVIENPTRVHSIYSESKTVAKDVFVDIFQEAGEYDVTITAYKNNVVMYERAVTHKVYVGVEPTIKELRTRLMFKLPGR